MQTKLQLRQQKQLASSDDFFVSFHKLVNRGIQSKNNFLITDFRGVYNAVRKMLF